MAIIKIILIVKMPLRNNVSHNNGILLKEVLVPNLLNNPLAFCSLINLYFLLLHTIHFDKSIVFL